MFKLLLLLVGIGLAASNRSHRFFYRRDYTYIAEFDAFYKFHWDPNVHTFTDAFKTCDEEGAKLFSPKEDKEWTIVNNLTDVNLMNTGEVILGDSPIIRQEFSLSISCVYMEITTGLHKFKGCFSLESIPLVCKKVAESPCPTIDLEYVYKKEVRKCYKVHNRQRTWQEAYHTCFLEGAMLVVVENESEAQQIRSMIEDGQTYHAGFSKNDTDYFTVTGERFENSNWWYDRNDDLWDPCGAVWRDGDSLVTKTVECHEPLSFVCEMAANVIG